MLAKDIATEFRTQVDDTDPDTEDQLWSDTELIRYMNLAIYEVASKTRCIRDSKTASIVQLTVTQDDAWVPYSDLILEFVPQTAYSQTHKRNYPIIEYNDFLGGIYGSDYDEIVTIDTFNWQTETGTPKVYVMGMQVEELRAYPIPTVADTLIVTASRLPINEITDVSISSVEVPEIPAKFHRELIVYMMYRAYLKQDAECYDKGLSDRYLREWTLEILPAMKRLFGRERESHSSVARYSPHG
jgi:hypothetical protein